MQKGIIGLSLIHILMCIRDRYKIVKRNIEYIENNLLKFGIAFFVLLTIVQILLYNVRGGYHTRDFANVFTGAYNYTITGKIEDPYLDYFYKYPKDVYKRQVYGFILTSVSVFVGSIILHLGRYEIYFFYCCTCYYNLPALW